MVNKSSTPSTMWTQYLQFCTIQRRTIYCDWICFNIFECEKKKHVKCNFLVKLFKFPTKIPTPPAKKSNFNVVMICYVSGFIQVNRWTQRKINRKWLPFRKMLLKQTVHSIIESSLAEKINQDLFLIFLLCYIKCANNQIVE